MNPDYIVSCCEFKAVRSSGAGGQHVNKVSSKIQLSLDIPNCVALNDHEKVLILRNLSSRINKSGVLILSCDESRSQHQNKGIVVQRLFAILEGALYVPKHRKPSKPSRSSILRQKKKKTQRSETKAMRRKPNLDA